MDHDAIEPYPAKAIGLTHLPTPEFIPETEPTNGALSAVGTMHIKKTG